MSANTISVPALVQMKPNALDRLGIYLTRARHVRVAIMHSSGLKLELLSRALDSLAAEGVSVDCKPMSRTPQPRAELAA